MKKLVVFVLLMAALLAGIWFASSRQHDFTLLDGETGRWRDGLTLVSFFAEWCAPCLQEIPQLNRLNQQLPVGVRLISVNWDRVERGELVRLKNQYEIEYPILASWAENMPLFHYPSALPTLYIIDADGHILAQMQGYHQADEILERLKDLH